MEPAEYAQRVARNAAAAIEAANVSQIDVADATGKSEATISRRLNGKGKALDLVELYQIARLTGVPVESLTVA